MNKELKEKWVTALRSGEYEQAREALCKNNGECDSYCCLGVLCEVAGLEKIPASTNAFDFARYVSPYDFSPSCDCWDDDCDCPKDFEEMTGELEEGFMNHIGLPGDAHEQLIGMNDNEGFNFNQIADWIEENL